MRVLLDECVPRALRKELPSPLRLIEMPQIRWWLALADRHQEPVGAQHVVIATDLYMVVVLGTDALPVSLAQIGIVLVAFDDRPGARQGIVDGRDLVDEEIRIGPVTVDSFLDDSLVVAVQRDTSGIKRARTLHVAGLDFER